MGKFWSPSIHLTIALENKNKQTYIQTDRHPTALYKGIAGKHTTKFELNWLGHLGGTVKQKHSLHIVYNRILEIIFFRNNGS